MNPLLKPIRWAVMKALGPIRTVRAGGRSSSGHGHVTGVTTITSGGGGYFSALRDTLDRTRLPLFSPEVRGFVSSMDRQTLAEFGAYLYDNNGMVSYAVDTMCNYSGPIIPQAASADDDWNTAAEEYFAAWSDQAEFTGRFDFEETQRQILKSMTTGGDVLAVMVGENGLPQIQLNEGWRIRSGEGMDDRGDGVRKDSKGRVLGYYLDDGDGKTVPVDRNVAFLVADLDRPSSYRGLTPLRRGMNDIRDTDDLKAMEKICQKVRASLPAVLEGDAPIEENVWSDDVANAPAEDATPHEKKLGIAELLGGDIPSLPSGKKLKLLTENRDAMPVTEFIAALAAYFVYGLGIPPAFFLDLKGTGPNTRSVNGKAQRVFNQRKRILRKFVLWTWRRVIGDAIARGALPSNPEWDKVTFLSPPAISIDTGDEEKADADGLKNGYRTRQEVHGKRGGDWQNNERQITREQRFVIEECKTLVKETGVPMAVLLSARGFAAAKDVAKATEKSEGNEPEETEATDLNG
jgi:capsid protein